MYFLLDTLNNPIVPGILVDTTFSCREVSESFLAINYPHWLKAQGVKA